MVYYPGFHLTTSEVLFMKYSELAAVAADLRTSPPVFAVTPARERALRRLDELFGEADSEYAPAMGRFYRAQVDRALTEIAAYSGATPRFWKLYSSGFVIKSARPHAGGGHQRRLHSGPGRLRLLLFGERRPRNRRFPPTREKK